MIVRASTALQRPLSTGEMAELINQILQAAVYSDRLIRAEIDAGRIRAFEVGGGQRRRRRVRVTPDDFLAWARQVLHDEELARLQAALPRAS